MLPSRRLHFWVYDRVNCTAIAIQDKVFMGGKHIDPVYAARRETAFLIAVNCGSPAGTCFCVSMNTGPRADRGFDLALTEVLDSDSHYFVVEMGSERGAQVLSLVRQSAGATRRSVGGRPGGRSCRGAHGPAHEYRRH